MSIAAVFPSRLECTFPGCRSRDGVCCVALPAEATFHQVQLSDGQAALCQGHRTRYCGKCWRHFEAGSDKVRGLDSAWGRHLGLYLQQAQVPFMQAWACYDCAGKHCLASKRAASQQAPTIPQSSQVCTHA